MKLAKREPSLNFEEDEELLYTKRRSPISIPFNSDDNLVNLTRSKELIEDLEENKKNLETDYEDLVSSIGTVKSDVLQMAREIENREKEIEELENLSKVEDFEENFEFEEKMTENDPDYYISDDTLYDDTPRDVEVENGGISDDFTDTEPKKIEKKRETVSLEEIRDNIDQPPTEKFFLVTDDENEEENDTEQTRRRFDESVDGVIKNSQKFIDKQKRILGKMKKYEKREKEKKRQEKIRKSELEYLQHNSPRSDANIPKMREKRRKSNKKKCKENDNAGHPFPPSVEKRVEKDKRTKRKSKIFEKILNGEDEEKKEEILHLIEKIEKAERVRVKKRKKFPTPIKTVVRESLDPPLQQKQPQRKDLMENVKILSKMREKISIEISIVEKKLKELETDRKIVNFSRKSRTRMSESEKLEIDEILARTDLAIRDNENKLRELILQQEDISRRFTSTSLGESFSDEIKQDESVSNMINIIDVSNRLKEKSHELVSSVGSLVEKNRHEYKKDFMKLKREIEETKNCIKDLADSMTYDPNYMDDEILIKDQSYNGVEEEDFEEMYKNVNEDLIIAEKRYDK